MKSQDAREATEAVQHGTPVGTSQTSWHLEHTYSVVTNGNCFLLIGHCNASQTKAEPV